MDGLPAFASRHLHHFSCPTKGLTATAPRCKRNTYRKIRVRAGQSSSCADHDLTRDHLVRHKLGKRERGWDAHRIRRWRDRPDDRRCRHGAGSGTTGRTDPGRSGASRLGKSGDRRTRAAGGQRDGLTLRNAGGGACGRSCGIAALPVAGRSVAVRADDGGRVAGRVRAARFRRIGVEKHQGPRRLAGGGIRPAALQQHHLSLSRRPPADPACDQPGRQLSPRHHAARRLVGQRRDPPHRRGRIRLLCLGQWPEGRLCAGQQAAERLRRHPVRQARAEHRRDPDLPLVRRQLSGRPGFLARLRDRAVGLSVAAPKTRVRDIVRPRRARSALRRRQARRSIWR